MHAIYSVAETKEASLPDLPADWMAKKWSGNNFSAYKKNEWIFAIRSFYSFRCESMVFKASIDSRFLHFRSS